jgi:hypothetical protein
VIDSRRSASFEIKLESAEGLLDPILKERDGLPTALKNRMRALAEKILLRTQDVGEKSDG